MLSADTSQGWHGYAKSGVRAKAHSHRLLQAKPQAPGSASESSEPIGSNSMHHLAPTEDADQASPSKTWHGAALNARYGQNSGQTLQTFEHWPRPERAKAGRRIMERQALTQQDPDYPDGFRLYGNETDVPWKAIYLAGGLLLAGVVLLFTGVGLWATDPEAHGMQAGHVHACTRSVRAEVRANNQTTNRVVPAGFVLFTLGLVMFVPGAYYSRIAYYAYKGHPGFSFDTIPAV